MLEKLIRRLQYFHYLVAFGCGIWLIVLAKEDKFDERKVALVAGVYLCSKLLLLVAAKLHNDYIDRS